MKSTTTEATTTTVKIYQGDINRNIAKTTLHDTDDNVTDDNEVHELKIQCVTTAIAGHAAPSLISDAEMIKAIQSVASSQGSINPNRIIEYLAKAGFNNCDVVDSLSPNLNVGNEDAEDRVEAGKNNFLSL